MNQDGFVFIHDRKDDLVNVSGFNVYPTEVEQVINQLQGVFECGCVGVVDEKSGEVIKAFIKLTDDSQLSADDIITHCRQHLTSYKIPRSIEFVDDLPKTNVGKVLRRALR